MNDTPPPGPLRDKLRPPPGPLDQAGMTPAKAMRRGLTRALERCIGLEATVLGFEQDRLGLAALVGSLESNRLIFMTQRKCGAIGLGIWDMTAVSAVVEHMVTGRVVPGPAEDRTPTATDAAVLRDMFDRIMQQFDETLSAMETAPPVTGFRASSIMENARAVELALEEMDYRRYVISVDFSGGAKTGELQLIFPWHPEFGTSAQLSQSRRWSREWQAAVKSSRARLDAVLCRLPMPLEQVGEMRVGDLIKLPRSALDAVSIEGADGQAVATGRLGQAQGMRAIRLHGLEPSPVDLPAAQPPDAGAGDGLEPLPQELLPATAEPAPPAVSPGPGQPGPIGQGEQLPERVGSDV